MQFFLEQERIFMIEQFVTKLPKNVTIDELLSFYPLISRRTIFRYIKNKKFKYQHFYNVIYIDTLSFVEFLFEI